MNVGPIDNVRLKRLAKYLQTAPSLKEAMIKAGYSDTYARAGLIWKTEGFKKYMKPITEQLLAERQRIIDALKEKDISQEKYKDLMSSFDILTKNIQLLSGQPTEINKIDLSELTDAELYDLATNRDNERVGGEGISEATPSALCSP